ncbi:glycosyltransferase family A protein [Geotalea sp. SG265]|uniref:glycosyltransferase family A protein n=1 Tax=Geotalea sp. SG265 TaxID=2922867 RepID=UPI001FAFB49E|nr:glycosyltransferase family A protein [Geotalea sp. SG265]
MSTVSVVIPCFNHGRYLAEAVDSALDQTYEDLEVVVVNDGSTDPETIQLLQEFSRPRTRIIHTPNKGLAAARNTGIQASSAAYILPLDADDLIGSTYVEQAVAILERQPEIGIVYCHAEKFGAMNGNWQLPAFSPARICIENPIFCTALFRKSDWELVGGYKTYMKYGWEDWDFWLSLAEAGRQVFQLPETLFKYRNSSQSMTNSMSYFKKFLMLSQLVLHHSGYYFNQSLRLLLRT